MMKNLSKLSAVICGVLLLTACASNGAPEPQPAIDAAVSAEVATSSAERPALSSVPRKGLPPQLLQPGDCGLFLWSQTDARKFIFFRKAGDGFARMLIGETNTPLLATDFSGDIFGQFFTKQKFDAQNGGHSIDLSFTPGEELIEGARISSGRIRVTDAEGWVTTIPIVGVRACQPELEEEETERAS